jgi:hypothetical protein
VNVLVAVACVVTALFGALLGRVIREREEPQLALLEEHRLRIVAAPQRDERTGEP